MREKMIAYIERCSGAKGDWTGWTDENIRKLYDFFNPVTSPVYLEDVEFI